MRHPLQAISSCCVLSDIILYIILKKDVMLQYWLYNFTRISNSLKKYRMCLSNQFVNNLCRYHLLQSNVYKKLRCISYRFCYLFRMSIEVIYVYTHNPTQCSVIDF